MSKITDMDFWISIYESWMRFGLIAPFLLAFVESLVPALPFAAIVALNVTTYGGILGFFMSYLGTTCGSLCVFLFFRFFIKTYVSPYVKAHQRLSRLSQWIAESSDISLLILLSVPFMPSSFINLGYGLSDFPKMKFIYLLLIGKFISTICFALFGKTIEQSLENPLFIILACAILIALLLVSKKIKEKIGFHKVEKDQ